MSRPRNILKTGGMGPKFESRFSKVIKLLLYHVAIWPTIPLLYKLLMLIYLYIYISTNNIKMYILYMKINFIS